jgi:hypothetical protein
MLNYSILSKKPTHFRNFSGIELTEFNTLNLKIKKKYTAYEEKRLTRTDRKKSSRRRPPLQTFSNRPLTHAANVLPQVPIINTTRVPL